MSQDNNGIHMKVTYNGLKIASAYFWMHTVAGRGEFKCLLNETATVLPDALPEHVCFDLRRRIDDIVDKPNHPRVWRDNAGSDSRIMGFEQEIGDLARFFDLDRFITAVDQYTGRKTKSWYLMANRVVPRENNLGSGGGMHRDSPFSHQVKCIWYLDNVNGENGPFRYVPGTNVNLFKKRAIYPLGQSRIDNVSDEMKEIHAGAGTLLVCDTKCIHGGKPIQKGARYAVTLYALPKENSAARMFESSGLDPRLARRSNHAL